MEAVKRAGATAKEKMHNVTAKTEAKVDKGKVEAAGKTEKMTAHDKVEKEQAKAAEHMKKAEVLDTKHDKMDQNAAQKEEVKHDLKSRKHAAKDAAKDAYNTPQPQMQ